MVHEDVNPLCGDRLRVELRFGAGRDVETVRFQGDACAIATASADLLAEMVEGRPVSDALPLERDALLRALEAPIRTSRLSCVSRFRWPCCAGRWAPAPIASPLPADATGGRPARIPQRSRESTGEPRRAGPSGLSRSSRAARSRDAGSSTSTRRRRPRSRARSSTRSGSSTSGRTPTSTARSTRWARRRRSSTRERGTGSGRFSGPGTGRRSSSRRGRRRRSTLSSTPGRGARSSQGTRSSCPRWSTTRTWCRGSSSPGSGSSGFGTCR